jgi:colanic acid/amylovoran biosynthesis glycosyltransferase
LFDQAELMLPVTEHFRERLIEFGCPAAKIRVQRMGVDIEDIPFRPRASKAEREKFELLSVGRCVEKKGFAQALRALAPLAAANLSFCYHVVGDGPLRDEWLLLSRELGLGDRVVFHGSLRRDQVAELRDRADILLAPSVTAANGDQEGLPVALMEAMAAGLPVIATQHSGIGELVVHEKTGLLVPERAVPALSSALRRLIESAELRHALASNARSLVCEKHALSSLNDELAACLRSLASR